MRSCASSRGQPTWSLRSTAARLQGPGRNLDGAHPLRARTEQRDGSGRILWVSLLSAHRFRPYRWGVLLVLLGFFAVNDVVIGVGQLITPHAGTVDFRVYFAAAQALEHGR